MKRIDIDVFARLVIRLGSGSALLVSLVAAFGIFPVVHAANPRLARIMEASASTGTGCTNIIAVENGDQKSSGVTSTDIDSCEKQETDKINVVFSNTANSTDLLKIKALAGPSNPNSITALIGEDALLKLLMQLSTADPGYKKAAADAATADAAAKAAANAQTAAQSKADAAAQAAAAARNTANSASANAASDAAARAAADARTVAQSKAGAAAQADVAAKTARSQAADRTKQIGADETRINQLMGSVGLNDPITGSLVGGPVLGSTGKLSAATGATGATGTAATSAASTTNALAHVEFTSKHYGEDKSPYFEGAFGGSFGLQPALSLLTTSTTGATGSTGATGATGATGGTGSQTSQYQSAFVWDVKARGIVPFRPMNSELSVYGRAGQIRLITGNGATIVDQGANSTLAIPVNGAANQSSWFYEYGADFNVYSNPLEIVHLAQSTLTPMFNVGIAYRFDDRFNQNSGLVGFTSPDRRLIFRFAVNAIRIFDLRSSSTSNSPYSVSFGVQTEKGFGSNPIPSGTTIIISGDVDLLKAIMGTPSQ